MEVEEIVEGDEPDTEDGFEPELGDSEDFGEFDSDLLAHRRLKKIRVAYTKSRSSYTKTTKTNVYYKPPVTKKVYVPPVYKKVARYVPPKPAYKAPVNTYRAPAYVAPRTAYIPPKTYYVRP